MNKILSPTTTDSIAHTRVVLGTYVVVTVTVSVPILVIVVKTTEDTKTHFPPCSGTGHFLTTVSYSVEQYPDTGKGTTAWTQIALKIRIGW